MRRIDELIMDLCPNGVPFKTMGELGKFYGGLTGKSKSDFTDGNATFISYKNVYSNPALDINPADTVKIADGEKQRTLAYGDVVFTGSSETPDECGLSSVVTRHPTKPLYLNSFCFFFRFDNLTDVDPDFMKHLFRSNSLRYQIGKTASGVTRFNVSKDKMAKVVIPIPPLHIQHEIVRTLDSFSELTAELAAELTAELTKRKKQYRYYVDMMISGAKNKTYPMVELRDIAHFVYGFTDKAKDFGNVRFIRITDILDNGTLNPDDSKFIDLTNESAKYLLHKGDLVMARTGATYGKTLFIPDDRPAVYASFLIKIELDNSKLLNRFYWHFTQSNMYWEQAKKLVSTGGQPQFNSGAIGRVKIPMPSILEQKHIVEMLDTFATVVSSVYEGLLAEIAARQKQYEYYRDKLLTFKPKEEVSV